MDTALTVLNGMDQAKVELIKQTVAKGATNLELELFLHACKRTGLDPLMKQIYAIKRWNAKSQKEEMSIQTGIDGYRLIADRTGCYAGSDDALYSPVTETRDSGPISAATVTVYKLVNGQRCAFTASARWNEYVQLNREGKPTSMWQKMPYCMLAKCAEALALRKAFPAELSGVYTHEEMMQADSEPDRTNTNHAYSNLNPGEVVIHDDGTATQRTMQRVDTAATGAPTTVPATESVVALPPVATDSPKFPFKGPWKGKPLTVVDVRELESALAFINRTIDDPKNQQFRQRNEEMALAMQAEITRRNEEIEEALS